MIRLENVSENASIYRNGCSSALDIGWTRKTCLSLSFKVLQQDTP